MNMSQKSNFLVDGRVYRLYCLMQKILNFKAVDNIIGWKYLIDTFLYLKLTNLSKKNQLSNSVKNLALWQIEVQVYALRSPQASITIILMEFFFVIIDEWWWVSDVKVNKAVKKNNRVLLKIQLCDK